MISITRIPLPNDYRTPQVATTQAGSSLAIDEVAITLHFADDDPSEGFSTDIIDLSDQKDSTNTDYRKNFRLGTRDPDGKQSEILADGSADGRWWSPGDDDARLQGTFKNLIPWEFVDRIAHPKTTFLPPAGNQVGDA
jgi:hypothetical protein